MADHLSSISIGNLLNRLHESIVRFVHNVEEIVHDNNSIKLGEIEQLREHIEERIKKGEDVADNERTLKIIELFLTDKYVMEFIKEDADEWLDFINTIEHHLSSRKAAEGEKEDINEISRNIAKLQEILRK